MRKTTVFGIIMLSLILLMTIMPVVNAATCYWDGLRFEYDHSADGGWIKYPHPDRVFYNISPYTTTGRNGTKLHHLQIGHNDAIVAVASVTALCACIAGAIGAGSIVAAALGVFIPVITEVFFLDEYQCIWVWVTLEFLAWWNANAFYLFWISITQLGGFADAVGRVVGELLKTGYLQIGTVTFIDSLDISSGGLGAESAPIDKASLMTQQTDKASLMMQQTALALIICVGLVVTRQKLATKQKFGKRKN